MKNFLALFCLWFLLPIGGTTAFLMTQSSAMAQDPPDGSTPGACWSCCLVLDPYGNYTIPGPPQDVPWCPDGQTIDWACMEAAEDRYYEAAQFAVDEAKEQSMNACFKHANAAAGCMMAWRGCLANGTDTTICDSDRESCTQDAQDEWNQNKKDIHENLMNALGDAANQFRADIAHCCH